MHWNGIELWINWDIGLGRSEKGLGNQPGGTVVRFCDGNGMSHWDEYIPSNNIKFCERCATNHRL